MGHKLFFIILINLFVKHAISEEINISAKLIQNFCTEYFGMINVTFENSTSKWVEINKVDLSFGNPEYDNKIVLVTGEKLVNWEDAINLKAERDALYTRVVLGAIAVAGAVSSNGNSNIRAAGLGAAGALTISEIRSAKTKIDLGHVVPRTHLFGSKILIPPGLWVNRWAVFNTDPADNVPFITNITINAELASDKVVSKNIKLRLGNDNFCQWQSKLIKEEEY